MKYVVCANGRAVIFDDKNPIYTLEVNTDASDKKIVDVKPYEQGLHLGMWLQPALSSCSETKCMEEFPFPALQAHLIHWAWIETLMSLFLIIIEEYIYSIELRKMGVEEFETTLQVAPEDARKEFECIILDTPPPGGMNTRDISFTGLSAELMEKFVAKFGHQPPNQPL